MSGIDTRIGVRRYPAAGGRPGVRSLRRRW
jgi:hypothetical protein